MLYARSWGDGSVLLRNEIVQAGVHCHRLYFAGGYTTFEEFCGRELGRSPTIQSNGSKKNYSRNSRGWHAASK